MAWEHLSLVLARRCGIHAAESSLVKVAGKNVLLVRRFDRTTSARIGYVSAMTMLEANEGDAGSYIDITEVITENGLSVTRDLEELWRRIAFSIAISNTDDHLRNHGFLRNDVANGWDLSPAFDLNPEPRAKKPLLVTPIRPGEHAADFRLLLEEISAFRVHFEQAQRIASEINTAVGGWRELAHDLGISAAEQDRLSVAFHHLDVD